MELECEPNSACDPGKEPGLSVATALPTRGSEPGCRSVLPETVLSLQVERTELEEVKLDLMESPELALDGPTMALLVVRSVSLSWKLP